MSETTNQRMCTLRDENPSKIVHDVHAISHLSATLAMKLAAKCCRLQFCRKASANATAPGEDTGD